MRCWVHALLLGVASLLTPRGAAGQAPVVRPGIDVLVEDSLVLVAGRATGVLTNRAAVDRHGVPDVDRLRAAGVHVVAIFTPEHGYRVAAAPGAAVASTRDSATGLPIYSLYGGTRAPTAGMLAGIEILLVDLPDAGARYFTYIASTIELMRAAAAAGIPVVILDRPNPIGGAVQGNVLDESAHSFVGSLAVPMRHGMTLGELARLARTAFALRTDLAVVPVSGWRRSQYLDATGLPFRAPSPNLPDLESLVSYPGTCLFEGTNLSVGRGTSAPFSQVGAPWLDPGAVLRRLGAQPGVALTGVSFTPSQPGDAKFADTLVQGIRIRVTDRAAYDSPALALRLLEAIRAVHPHEFAWNVPHFDRLAAEPGLREAIDRGARPDSILAVWRSERAAFEARVAGLRLYPE
jgi:uncharacterized protein YbbC (DUF1343 family)